MHIVCINGKDTRLPFELSKLISHQRMKNDFALLSRFLENLSPEVAARSVQEPLTDQQTRLIGQFANGELADDERESLLPALLGNETALQALVQAIRAQQ